MESLIIGAVCLILVGVTCFRGYRNGFLRTAFSMVALAVSIALVGIVSPYIKGFLEATPMPQAIYNSVSRNMEKTMDEMLEGMGKTAEDDVALNEEEQQQWMTISNIPKWVQGKVVEKTEQSVDQVVANVSQYITDSLINIISYVCTLLLIFLLIEGISLVLGIVNYIPILGGLNRKLGAVLGLMQGLLILWVICLVLTIFTPSEWGGHLISIIESNSILAWIYHFMIGIGRG